MRNWLMFWCFVALVAAGFMAWRHNVSLLVAFAAVAIFCALFAWDESKDEANGQAELRRTEEEAYVDSVADLVQVLLKMVLPQSVIVTKQRHLAFVHVDVFDKSTTDPPTFRLGFDYRIWRLGVWSRLGGGSKPVSNDELMEIITSLILQYRRSVPRV